MKIVSWNLNGIRAAQRHGFLEWLALERPDILCVQEIKARPEQLDQALLHPEGYEAFWQPAERKGYSGTAVFARKAPERLEPLGVDRFDREGRTQVLFYPDFVLINAYFPNSREAGARLEYKIEYCDAVLDRCQALRQAGRRIILCGDFNIAHKPIDLANPKANENNPGYLPEERAWMDKFLAAGYVDTFRMFHPEPGCYTWWTYRFHARERNIGWRIDYFCVNTEARDLVQDSEILDSVMGSDHCPIRLTLNPGA